jgi:sulfotransferase family protein
MTNGTGHPVAVGGIGGSGTRIIAALLAVLGYHLGDDLNEAMDNLWFTLLFKRRSILVDTEAEFAALAALFLSRMSGAIGISEEDRARVFRLAQCGRVQHSRDWLIERATSFCNGRTSKRAGQPWAWKEPNTHVVIERIWASRPDLRYIHVVRHPLDMALSANRNQLENWGPIFLNSDVPLDARSSLSYWCRAHRRIAALMARRSGRALMVDFDALCIGPHVHGVQIAGFLGADFPDEALARFRTLVHRPESTGRFAGADLRQFDPDDLEYVSELGYRF